MCKKEIHRIKLLVALNIPELYNIIQIDLYNVNVNFVQKGCFMKPLIFGDLSPTDASNPYFEMGDIDTLFTDTLPLFEGNDINFVNVECALTHSENIIKKFGPALKATPNTAQVLKKIGVNYCTRLNNHIFDYGIKGVCDTMDALDKAGIVYTGFGKDYEDARKNLVVEKNGEKVCFITVCEHEYSYATDDRMGARGYDAYDTIDDIRKAKEQNDCVIVIYHGGKEQCRYPSPRLMKICHAMVDNGADAVFCQHSHCIGCYEKYNDGHILYGQGNFHFVKGVNGNPPESWNTLLAVKYDTKTKEIEFVPVNNTDNGITLSKGELKDKIMREFEERNQSLIDGKWRDGWRNFCISMKEQYESVIDRALLEENPDLNRQRFSHYLDCEAHLDVFRELFPSWNDTNEKQC